MLAYTGTDQSRIIYDSLGVCYKKDIARFTGDTEMLSAEDKGNLARGVKTLAIAGFVSDRTLSGIASALILLR